jgi:ribosomal protein L24E
VRVCKASDHIAIPPRRFRIFLSHEGEATKAIHKGSAEIVVRRVAFQSHTLPAIAIEQEHRRSPDCIKAVEPGRVFLYVRFDGKKVLVDELGSSLICIRLGIQPSTCSSSRSRAEIQQDWAGLLLCCGQGLMDILAPLTPIIRLFC